MQVRTIARALTLLTVLAVFSASVLLAEGAAHSSPRPELALGYTFVHSNAPPGGCTCFSLNGGNATLAWPVKATHFALVADIAATHAGSITSANYNLTLYTFTGGVRYQMRWPHTPLHPYAQVLIGVAHAGGTLVQLPSASVSNAGAAFAANLGGGLDLRLNSRFSWRVVDAAYLLTDFDNGTNNRQNNLRLGTGIVFRF